MNTERDIPEQIPTCADLYPPAAGSHRSATTASSAPGADDALGQFIATHSLRVAQHRADPIQTDLLYLFSRGYSYTRLCQYAQIHNIKVDRSEMRRYIQAVLKKSKSNIERAALLDNSTIRPLQNPGSNTSLPSSSAQSQSIQERSEKISPSPAPTGQARETTSPGRLDNFQIQASQHQTAIHDENQRDPNLPGNSIVPKVKLSGFIKDSPKVTIEPNKGSGKS